MMSLISKVEELFDDLKDALEAKFGGAVRQDATALLDSAKDQVHDLVRQAADDARTDAATVVDDVHELTSPAQTTAPSTASGLPAAPDVPDARQG